LISPLKTQETPGNIFESAPILLLARTGFLFYPGVGPLGNIWLSPFAELAESKSFSEREATYFSTDWDGPFFFLAQGLFP
jgi:hypothetical protein